MLMMSNKNQGSINSPHSQTANGSTLMEMGELHFPGMLLLLTLTYRCEELFSSLCRTLCKMCLETDFSLFEFFSLGL